MPAAGTSGLPASLEAGVPHEYRYWAVGDAGRAREVRDALVESGLLTKQDVMLVDGEPRRVVTRPHLAVVVPPEGEVQYAELFSPALTAATCVEQGESPAVVLEVDEAPALAELAETVAGKPWVVAYAEGDGVREGLSRLAKSVFTLATRPGLVFASSQGLLVGSQAVPVGLQEARVVKDSRGVRLLKAASEERYVLGVVLEPETED